MPELLSQDEINALLSAFESAKPEGKSAQTEKRQREVRLYDFSRPDRFSKEHLRTLHIIHSNFAADLAAAFSSLYQSPTRVDLISVDQVSYKDYLASIPSRTMLAEIAVQPLNADVLFEINPSIMGIWVDYLCGSSPQMASEPSDLTPLDLAVAKQVLKTCLEVYSESWANIVELRSEVRRIMSSDNYDGALLPAETVLACSCEINAGQSVGMMSICIPAAAVDSVLPVLSSSRVSCQANRRHEADAADIKKALDSVDLPCRAILGRATISIGDIMSLEVGDLIRTDRRADAGVELWVGPDHLYSGTPGLRGKKLSVMVSETLPQETETETLRQAA